jgi:hypothetical protein
VYPTARQKALDGKIREFVHAVRGYQDTEKFNTFGRFMGYDLETSHSVRHYYFYCELLDCLKRLTVRGGGGSAVAQLQSGWFSYQLSFSSTCAFIHALQDKVRRYAG